MVCWLGHAFFGVFVGENSGASGVKGCVVVGMVEMPVGIHDEFQRSAAEAIEGLF